FTLSGTLTPPAPPLPPDPLMLLPPLAFTEVMAIVPNVVDTVILPPFPAELPTPPVPPAPFIPLPPSGVATAGLTELPTALSPLVADIAVEVIADPAAVIVMVPPD